MSQLSQTATNILWPKPKRESPKTGMRKKAGIVAIAQIRVGYPKA
jgi:hypothetical protein